MISAPTRRPVLGLLLNSLFDGYEAAICQHVVRSAAELGADLVCYLGGAVSDGTERSTLFRLARPECVDALIVVAGTVGIHTGPSGVAALLAQLGPLPAVSIGEAVPEAPSLLVENAAGVAELMEHLVAGHGHRRIAYVGGPARSPEAETRLAAYREALARFQLPYDPQLVVDGDWGPSAGVQAVRTLWEARRVAVDAIFFSNDLMALAALEELRRLGVQVPGQVAVCGFDDVADAVHAAPPLTTARQPLREMAHAAVARAIALSRGEPAEPPVSYPARLVARRSCGCPARERDEAVEDGGTPSHGRWVEEEARVLHRLIQPFPLPDDAFIRNLRSGLDVLGVRSFFLCRYASGDLREAELIMSHDPDGIAELADPRARFASCRLIPGRFRGGRHRAHAVLPIESPDGAIGFAVIELGSMSSSSYEMLMHQISMVLSMNRLLREVQDQHRQLLETARQAGMTEVAVGALHNVGNLVSSVSVSAEEIRDAAAGAATAALARASEALTRDLARIQAEAARLQERTGLIRESIRALQDHARGGRELAERESVELAVLVRSALEIERVQLDRWSIRVEQQLDGVPPLVVPRSKLVHVLVNLVKNAVEAMRDTAEDRRRLTVRASREDGRIRLDVVDSGHGISEADLPRIFSYGFTTKPDGHGFGLHTCASYMKQMGGSIRVVSPGPGRGATFTLLLEPGGGDAGGAGGPEDRGATAQS